MMNQNIRICHRQCRGSSCESSTKADVGGEAGKGSTESMRQEHAFENLGEGQIATKLKGCNRGVTATTDLSTLFTTASQNVAYDIVGEASPRPARRYRAAASKKRRLREVRS